MRESHQISVLYHSIFSCKLNKDDLDRWQAGPALTLTKKYVEPKITPRQVGEQKTKFEIATKAAKVISRIPFVKMVGVTGSLAMNSAQDWADIDLMLVVKKDTLWISRPFVYLALILAGLKTRQPESKDEKDLLCLNVWVDESALSVPNKRRDAYTAHEVLAVVPVYDQGGVFDNWLSANSWAGRYWPKAQKIPNGEYVAPRINMLLSVFNRLFFVVQYLYMIPKLSVETVRLNEAYFHPFDWGEKVILKLKEHGVIES